MEDEMTHSKTAREFLDSAESRETSTELMRAILDVAGGDAELTAIVEIVTNNGTHDTTEFCWGAAGTNWASE
ncbi:MAG: hypothetical protein D6773_11380 [Alphaproteobacteria bacterium]|nr:MAG: hypothetical protein D6773_11380 [Alphaproteobacteria bacterium]